MRYRLSPSSPWVYAPYLVTIMARVVMDGLEYGIEGRDYSVTPTHWGVSA